MDFLLYIEYVKTHWINLAVQTLLTFLTYILIRYKYKRPSSVLFLSKKTKARLLNEFEPVPLIEKPCELYTFKQVKANFSNYDVFNLGCRYKDEIKAIIREYGVGTCGPRGFYGTLDVHLELERKLATVFGKEAAILYSNHFTCIQSIIPVFCKSNNNVFVHRNVSVAIQRGLTLARSKVFTYESFDDLENQLEKNDQTDKYIIVERFSTNTGEYLDIERLLDIKNRYGFRIILDESFTIPFVYQRPVDLKPYNSIDLIVGSLCHGYPANGAFCVGSPEAIDYERLAAASYVFSASLPAYICKAALCMLNENIDYSAVRSKISLAFKNLSGIVTNRSSPIVLVKTKDIDRAIRRLRDSGYVIGRNGDLIRFCINEKTEEEHLIEIGQILKTIERTSE